MKKALLAAATALSMVAVPATAQQQTREAPEDAPALYSAAHEEMLRELEPEARVYFDQLDEDQQAMYFGWNDALRDYYWTLDENQRDAWWYLNEDQRITIYQIQAPEQRAAAWDSVLTQVAEMEQGNATASQQATARTSASSDLRFVSNEMVQDAPAPHQGEYPVCESDADDNCINAWAAGQRGPGVDRPLDYWPGEPASS